MEEADKIFRAIFKQPMPDVLKDRYYQAIKLIENADPAAVRYCRAVIDSNFDLEALELAARITRRSPILVQKFQIMVYLAETMPELRNRFINREDRPLSGFLALGRASVKTVYLFCKGLILLRRIHHNE